MLESLLSQECMYFTIFFSFIVPTLKLHFINSDLGQLAH